MSTVYRRWLLLTVVLLVVLVVGYYWLEHYAERKIQAALAAASIDGQRIEVKTIDVCLLGRSVTADSLTVDYTLAKQSKRPLRITGTLERVAVRSVGLLAYLLRDEISLGTLQLDQPLLQVRTLPAADTTVSDSTNRAGTVFGINRLVINDASVEWRNVDSSLVLQADSLQARCYDLQQGDTSRAAIDQAEWELAHLTLPTGNRFYDFYIDHLTGSSQDSLVTFGQFRYSPRYDLDNYVKQLTYRSTWLAMRVDNGRLEGINPLALLRQDTLSMRLLSIEDFNLAAYEDNGLPRHPQPSQKLLPAAMIRRIGFPFRVRDLTIARSNITYGMRTAAGERGDLAFTDGRIRIQNVTNVQPFIQQRPQLHIDYRGRFNGVSPLTADFLFDLSRSDDYCRMSGKLGSYHLPDINPMLKPAGNVNIKTGELQHLNYEANYSAGVLNGYMQLAYQDLEVDLDGGIANVLDLVKGLAVRKENIPGKKFRRGIMYYEHDYTRAFLGMFWKGILSGLQSSVLSNRLLPDELEHSTARQRKRRARRAARKDN